MSSKLEQLKEQFKYLGINIGVDGDAYTLNGQQWFNEDDLMVELYRLQGGFEITQTLLSARKKYNYIITHNGSDYVIDGTKVGKHSADLWEVLALWDKPHNASADEDERVIALSESGGGVRFKEAKIRGKRRLSGKHTTYPIDEKWEFEWMLGTNKIEGEIAFNLWLKN